LQPINLSLNLEQFLLQSLKISVHMRFKFTWKYEGVEEGTKTTIT